MQSEFVEGLVHTRVALDLLRILERITHSTKEKEASRIVDQLIHNLKSSDYFNNKLNNDLKRAVFIRAIKRCREQYNTLDFVRWELESSPEYQRAMTMLLGH